jgi:RNA recognition motif-containing protein
MNLDNPSNKIFVGNIKFTTSKDTLIKTFSRYGEVLNVSIPIYHDTKRPKGFAFITFATPQSAQKALSFKDSIDGRAVIINTATPERKTRKKEVEEI